MKMTRRITTKEKTNIKWENIYYTVDLHYLEDMNKLPIEYNLLTINIKAKGDYLPIEFSINDIYENGYELYTNLTEVRFMSQDNKEDILDKIAIASKSMDEIEECVKKYFPLK